MNHLATIALSSALLLLPALPAAASHADRSVPVRTEHRGAHGVQEAAHALEHETAQLLQRAVRSKRHPNRAVRRSIRMLRLLHAEARDFRQLSEDRRRLVPMVDDYHELHAAFLGARKHFKKLRPNKATKRQFQRVYARLGDLEQRRQGMLARQDRRRHDRHDGRRQRRSSWGRGRLAWGH